MKHEKVAQHDLKIALTPMQLGLLSESIVSGRPWVNVEQVVMHFGETPICENKVKAGLKALAQRHDAMQLMVRWDNIGRPSQMLNFSGDVPLKVVDRAAIAEDERSHQLEALLEEDRLEGFDLVDQILWRGHLIRWGGTHTVLILTLHHAIADGRSMAHLATDLLAFMQKGALPNSGSEQKAFSDFCQAITDTVPNQEKAEAYFGSYLKDVEDAGTLTLPGKPNAQTTGTRKRQVRHRVPNNTGAALKQVASRNGATLANLMQAAWGILLARWQGRDTVTFGVVRSGRHTLPDCIETVGCLINTLPARVTLDPNLTVSDVLTELRQHTLALHELEQTSPDLIRRSIGLHGKQPLFETAIMFENAGMEHLITSGSTFEGIAKIELREEGGMPLMLSVYAEDAIEIMLEFDPSSVSETIADRMFEHLKRLLDAFAASDNLTRVASLDMLERDERETLLNWSMPDCSLDADETCLVQRFRNVVETAPDARAIEEIGKSGGLSYAKLDQRSDQLAKNLLELGARPGEIVAIVLNRSADFVVAVFAILKTGAAFMPIDPVHPEALRDHMLSDSGARIIIHPDKVVCGTKTKLILDDPSPISDPIPFPPEDTKTLAYVIYTSGSTGKPKGVCVTRGNLLSHVSAITKAFETTDQDRTLQFAGLSFDVAIEEIFSTLMSGATLVLRDKEMAASVSAFLDQVETQMITVLNIPTAFWTVLTQFMRGSGRSMPSSVRLVIVGGERIAPQTLADWQTLAPNVRWLNGYGPTETTITCTLFEPSKAQQSDTEVPIGRPTAHARAYIISADGSLAPKGAVGELAIGGLAVSQGYIGRPEETEKSFRPNEFGPLGRIYCTGDRANWMNDGNLGFLGRQDRQIKMRGFRIDLRHIERAAEECLPDVEILCDVLDKGTPSARLVVWIASPEPPDLTRLADNIAALLPSYMRPKLAHVPEFPRTPNGKIDHQALPRPSVVSSPNTADKPDASKLEAQISETMAKVLGLPNVGLDQNFFDLGGHSLLSIEFIGRIEAATGKKLGIVDFYNNASPRDLAKLLEVGSQSSRHIIPIQPEGSKPPLLAIHILGANEEYFHPLARHLGPDQPVMGVSVGSLDENTPTGIEFTASRYCEDINLHYPDGPIHLMAVSLGSYMAFELAKQLRERGRDVGMLAFFDAAGPEGRDRIKGVRKIGAHLRRARYAGWGYPAQILRNRIHNLRNALASHQINRKTASANSHTPKTVFEFIASNELAVQQYTPKPLDVPLTIFRSESNFFDTDETRANGLGWGPVAKAGFHVIDVPGGHLSMLQEPHIGSLAAKMKKVLQSFSR